MKAEANCGMEPRSCEEGVRVQLGRGERGGGHGGVEEQVVEDVRVPHNYMQFTTSII